MGEAEEEGEGEGVSEGEGEERKVDKKDIERTGQFNRVLDNNFLDDTCNYTANNKSYTRALFCCLVSLVIIYHCHRRYR